MGLVAPKSKKRKLFVKNILIFCSSLLAFINKLFRFLFDLNALRL